MSGAAKRFGRTENAEKRGQPFELGVGQRREGPGILEELAPERGPQPLPLWGERQRLDAAVAGSGRRSTTPRRSSRSTSTLRLDAS